MTAKEYLSQAYRLEQRIHLSQLELEQLRELMVSVSAISNGENHNATRNTDAPFEKVLFKVMEMEEQEGIMLDTDVVN